MFGHLIRKEILDHLLSVRFLILTGIGALTIWLSLYSGYADYLARLRDYRLAQAGTEQRIRQIEEADQVVPYYYWYEVTNIGFFEHKPPTPMSIFIRGLDPTLGRSISTTGTPQRRLRRSPVEAEPILGVFPPLDLGHVAQVVLSLFVLLFIYNAICGEKENGTLRLVSSYPVPKHLLLLSKFTGICTLSLCAFGLPLLLGLAVLLWMPQVRITDPEWVRLGGIVVAFLLYLVSCTCAGLFASCLAHRSATSFVILLVYWVTTVVVVPKVSLIAADALRPAPSIHEHQAKRYAIQLQYLRKWREARRKWHEQHNEEWRRTPEGREAYRRYYLKTRDEILTRQSQPLVDRLNEDFRNKYDQRTRLAVVLARLSPAFAFRNTVARLAGTGIDRHQSFEETFIRNHIRQIYSPWRTEKSERYVLSGIHPAKYGKQKWDLTGIPRFMFQEAGPGEVLRKALVDVLVLVLWALVFFSGACVSMLRYDVR